MAFNPRNHPMLDRHMKKYRVTFTTDDKVVIRAHTAMEARIIAKRDMPISVHIAKIEVVS